jgi:hypothetical protein
VLVASTPEGADMETTPITRRGTGWITFAALMLIVSGTLDVMNGLWALDTSNTVVDTVFWNNNLEAWGWFYIGVGILLFAAGIGVFSRSRWAVIVGIVAGCLGAVVNIFWIFQYPVVSLLLVLLNVLVVYGLTTYGSREAPSEYR